jgi:uncharacterized membrane protein
MSLPDECTTEITALGIVSGFFLIIGTIISYLPQVCITMIQISHLLVV